MFLENIDCCSLFKGLLVKFCYLFASGHLHKMKEANN